MLHAENINGIIQTNSILFNLRAMLSKAKIKLVQSLKDKKYRQIHGLFVAEGNKTVDELLHSKIQVKTLFAISSWLQVHGTEIQEQTEVIEVTPEELKKIAFTQTPQDVLAIAIIPSPDQSITFDKNLILVLDTIQDPGNLGTIIRLADWYDIGQVICSPGCADPFNPKVVQASMGSLARVKITTVKLTDLFSRHPDVPVYGAYMEGESVYHTVFKSGFLLIGNEGSGISNELQPYITHRVTIPRPGQAESLNAAIATGIILDNRARQLR